jgi:hypothetical protein
VQLWGQLIFGMSIRRPGHFPNSVSALVQQDFRNHNFQWSPVLFPDSQCACILSTVKFSGCRDPLVFTDPVHSQSYLWLLFIEVTSGYFECWLQQKPNQALSSPMLTQITDTHEH